MKIVIANHEFRAHFPARIKYLHEHLKKNGHELKIIELFGKSICYEFSNDDKAINDWEILFPSSDAHMVDGKEIEQKLTTRLNEIDPDVVLSGIATFPVGIISLRWAKKNGKGIVEFGNARKDTFAHNKLIHQIKRMMFRNVDAFFCPSPAWDESMMYWGFKKKEIFYGLNVANNAFWLTSVENIHFHNLPQSYFLTCGRQVQMKNLPRLLKCFFKYKEEGGKLPLVMIGDGVLHDTLEEIAKGRNDVIFLPFLNHDKIKEVFVQARALLLPSFKEETWGIVANEAMASGVIVGVSNECGCSSTIVVDDYNGYTFSAYDENQIINTLHKIEQIPNEKFLQMKENARTLILDWGVERFAKGAFAAAEYALNNKKKINNPIDKLLINSWRGRMTVTNK